MCRGPWDGKGGKMATDESREAEGGEEEKEEVMKSQKQQNPRKLRQQKVWWSKKKKNSEKEKNSIVFDKGIFKENVCLLTMTFCIGFSCSISQVKSHQCGAWGGRRGMEWLYWQAGWETWEVWVAVHYLIVCNNSQPSPAWWKADLLHPIIQAKSQCCLSPLGSWLLWHSSLWISYKRMKFWKDEAGTGPKLQPYGDFYSK